MHCCYIFDTYEPADQKTVNAGMPVRCLRSIETESGCSLWTLLMRHHSTRRTYGNELCKCNGGWSRNMRLMECINQSSVWCVLCEEFYMRSIAPPPPSPQRRKRRNNVIFTHCSGCCSGECNHNFEFFVEIAFVNRTESSPSRMLAIETNRMPFITMSAAAALIRLHSIAPISVCLLASPCNLPIGQWWARAIQMRCEIRK